MIVLGLFFIFFIGRVIYRNEKWGREVERRFDPVITALDKYRNDSGEYPGSLDKLAPTYLAEIPICPFYHEQAYKKFPNETYRFLCYNGIITFFPYGRYYSSSTKSWSGLD